MPCRDVLPGIPALLRRPEDLAFTFRYVLLPCSLSTKKERKHPLENGNTGPIHPALHYIGVDICSFNRSFQKEQKKRQKERGIDTKGDLEGHKRFNSSIDLL